MDEHCETKCSSHSRPAVLEQGPRSGGKRSSEMQKHRSVRGAAMELMQATPIIANTNAWLPSGQESLS